jgi:hypothetical protein
MSEALSKEELEAAYCWEAEDRVPRRPELTEFRRRLRYHQAQWRAANGHPIGSQPIAPRPDGPARPVGSRLQLAYARESGANFLTAGALDAARVRTSFVEPHQSFDHQRLWADRAVHTWWPDVPGTVGDVRFAHSPGRLDPAWLGNLVAFDVAFVLDLGDGSEGIVGVVTAYHEVNRPQPPKPRRLPRYREITEKSGAFGPEAIDAVNGTELIHIWLEHLLVLSMLQHPSHTWRWGRLVVVHPAGNTDFADACSRYRALLVDRSTFSSATVEELVDAGVLPAPTTAALRERYLHD